jgi:hypothetical protein
LEQEFEVRTLEDIEAEHEGQTSHG